MRTKLLGLTVLALVGCNDAARTGRALQNIDSSDPAAVERAAIQPWFERGDQVQEIENALDAALRAQYSVGLTTADDYQRVVRTATIEWVREVRRNLGEPLHTSVEALADDPDCAGSVIGDAMLLDYVEAAFGPEQRTDRVVAALQALAHQTACLSQSQSTNLATAMKVAFDEVTTTLRIDQLEGAIPYLAQATSSPMLLVHDVERQHGADAPLSRWFTEYEGALVDGAATKHHPANWHGLWLYDRITGRMRGFRESDRSLDENTVELASLFHTIAQPVLDDQRCSLAEMIQRGSYLGRYQCLGAACAAGDEAACAVPAAAGDTAPEKGSVDVPGLSSSGALTCVTTAAAHSASREQLTCLMEATGRGAKPRDAIAKQMTEVPLAGVKGGGCNPYADQIDRDYNRRVAYNERAYQQTIDDALAQLTKAIDALAELNRDPATDATTRRKAEEAVNKAAKTAYDSYAKAAATLAAENKYAENAREQAREEEAEQAAGSGAGSGGGEGGSAGGGSAGGGGGGAGSGSDARCIDGASCGSCTALSAQAQAMLDCVTGDSTPEMRDPLNGPGGCGGSCDPIDPATPDSGRNCFGDLTLNVGSVLSQNCWAERCGPSDQGTSACCGGASTTGTPTLITQMCGEMDCADGGQPTYSGGKCTCGGSGTGLPTGAIVPTGPNPYSPYGPKY